MLSKVSIAASYHRLLRMATNLADTLTGHNQEVIASAGRQARSLSCANRHGRNPKRKKEGSISPTPAINSRKKPKPGRNKQANSNSGHDTESEDEPDEPDELEGAETEMRQIRICDVLHDYYEVAWRCINQLCCKDISKAWIRTCQPRKQTSHPYNGGKSSVERSKAEHGYLGHYSMPDYWPSDEDWKAGWGCRHKEPDHVRKPGQSVCELVPSLVLTSHLERLILLIHLLRSQGKGYSDGNFSIKKLRQATAGIHLECGKSWKSEYVDRLEEIYWVREKEMEFERGEIGESSSIRRRNPFVLTLRQMQIPWYLSECRNHVAKIAKLRSRPSRLKVHLVNRLRKSQENGALRHAMRLLQIWGSACSLRQTTWIRVNHPNPASLRRLLRRLKRLPRTQAALSLHCAKLAPFSKAHPSLCRPRRVATARSRKIGLHSQQILGRPLLYLHT